MKKILAIDPSGNFSEGKGKTGWALYSENDLVGHNFRFGTIKAEDFETRVDYWHAVTMLMVVEKPTTLVIEDYRLYNTPATSASVQSFSQLETPRLLGVLETNANLNKIPLIFQMANVSKPYRDEILEKLGILEKKGNRWRFRGIMLNDHERSSLRHLLRHLDKEKIKW
jgi:hypothetical protein